MKTIIRTFDTITESITKFFYGELDMANKSYLVFIFVSLCLGVAALTGMSSVAYDMIMEYINKWI